VDKFSLCRDCRSGFIAILFALIFAAVGIIGQRVDDLIKEVDTVTHELQGFRREISSREQSNDRWLRP
jgi:hypothetical protein